MNCREFQNILFKGLDSQTDKAFFLHKEKCEGCRILYELHHENYTDESLRQIKADDFFYSRLENKISKGTIKTFTYSRWLVAASIILILAFSGILGYMIGNPSSILYSTKQNNSVKSVDNEYFSLVSQNDISESYLKLISNE
ncbi:MAG TPA: hypothetical protein P5050_01540 [Bacteroidia bacterium]|nr:hypothetical protein [Sphingobacteriales bacterium]HPD64145.1 hypothetical protein [Bacteroidia bacterium]HRS57885.1 hypothetical protein [Bacteroidia bacterium]HRU68475.1 hypothetical protein [Bacteroidia bacterium]